MTPEHSANLILGGFIGFIFSLIVAYQARQRGYSMPVWTLAGMLSSNPLFLLVLLGVMPDFARKRQRAKELEDLESALRKSLLPRQAAGPETLPLPVRPDVRRSVGDQPTILPERSVGDDETRM